MHLVGRPKLAKALPRTAVEELLETVVQDGNSKRQTDWVERDLALVGGADRRRSSRFQGWR
jgi:integrase/recombinase XerC